MKKPTRTERIETIRDLGDVPTVYSKKLRTVQIRLRRSYARSRDIELATIGSTIDVYEVVKVIFSTLDDDQEHFIVLVCNTAQELTGYKVIASGAQDQVYVDPRIVFRSALLLGAHSIILAHNHPSGRSEPSDADLVLTGKLVLAGQIMDIKVLDHVIYSTRDWSSIRDKHPALFGDSPST